MEIYDQYRVITDDNIYPFHIGEGHTRKTCMDACYVNDGHYAASWVFDRVHNNQTLGNCSLFNVQSVATDSVTKCSEYGNECFTGVKCSSSVKIAQPVVQHVADYIYSGGKYMST